MITSNPFIYWMDAKHAANEAADDQGCAAIVLDGLSYRVIAGEIIDDCLAEAGNRVIVDSVVQGQRL